MPKHLAPAFIAALIASVLFLLVVGLGLGFFFLFLPTLPLLVAGLGIAPRAALVAALLAVVLITLAGGVPLGFMFLLFLGLPAWYIARYAVLWRPLEGGQKEWFPLGLIFTRLALFACGVVAVVTFYYAGEAGGIAQMLAQNLRAAFADLKGEYGEVIESLAGRWSFLIFSMTVWLWALALYLHLWFAQRILLARKKPVRERLGLSEFVMPPWMLSLLVIAGLASLIGGPSLQFLGKTVLMILLLPYFFLGCAIMHEASKTWPSRRFLLFFVYFMIFAQFWPALALSGVGLFRQIKRLSGAANSSKK